MAVKTIAARSSPAATRQKRVLDATAAARASSAAAAAADAPDDVSVTKLFDSSTDDDGDVEILENYNKEMQEKRNKDKELLAKKKEEEGEI